MLTKVIRIDKLGDFRLRIHFSDGTAGEHDFSALINRGGEMREPLRDPAYFQRVFLDFGALTWPNGYDMAPDWLQMELQAAGELRRDAA